MIYLWDASGPDRRSGGVTDDKDRALCLAGECLLREQATTAQVEVARLVLGTVTDEYRRINEGWRGRCVNDSVKWEPFGRARAAC